MAFRPLESSDLTIASKKRMLAHYGRPTQPAPSAGETSPPTIDLTAYRGCWVALVGGQVAGVGATAEAARLAAHAQPPARAYHAILWVPDQP